MNKRVMLALGLGVISLLVSVPMVTVAAGLNDTGITTCSNDTPNAIHN